MTDLFDFTGAYSGETGFNLVSRAVVVIGGTPNIVSNYNLTMNSYLEVDTCEMSIPMDLLDLSTLIKERRKTNQTVLIELWSGWLPSQNPLHDWTQDFQNLLSNEELKRNLLANYQDLLSLRWFGVLERPSYSGNSQGTDDIKLYCKEFTSILQQYSYEKKYEGESATVEAIVADLQKALKNFKLVFQNENDLPAFRREIFRQKKKVLMGLKTTIKQDDEVDEEVKEYSTFGKSYWDIIADICQTAKLKFVQSDKDLFTYEFRDIASSSTLWTLDRAKHFDNWTLDEGSVGNNSASKIGIRLFSKQTASSGIVEGLFPKDLNQDSPESMFFYNIPAAPDMTEDALEALAKDIATNLSKYSMTGNFTLPNAITNLKPMHLLNITDTTDPLLIPPGRKLTNLTGGDSDETLPVVSRLNFIIDSISESFSIDQGITQQVDFHLDEITNHIDIETGEVKGINLFPKQSDQEKEGWQPFIDPTTLPEPLQKMRQAGGI